MTEIDTFKKWLLSTDELAIKATGNSSYVYRHCADLVAKLVVVNTMQFKVITKRYRWFLIKNYMALC